MAMSNFFSKHLEWIIGASLMIFLVVCLIGLGAASFEEAKRWEAFSNAHDCKLTQKIKGRTHFVNTVMTNGQVGMSTVSESEKSCYACNDGVTYCR